MENLNFWDKELEVLVEFLKSKVEVLGVVLFGSYARKVDFSFKHSDVDLLVFVDLDFDLDSSEEYAKVISYEGGLISEVFEVFSKRGLRKPPFDIVFQYNKVDNRGKLLRYNAFKEGKVLFVRRNPVFYLREDLGCEVFKVVELDMGGLKHFEKSNLKRFFRSKFSEVVFYESGNVVIVFDKFFEEFSSLMVEKGVKFLVVGEFVKNVVLSEAEE